MKRLLLTYSLLALLTATTGCAMCESSFDNQYAAHGGTWQRADPEAGRVGSAFEPAEAMGGSPGAEVAQVAKVEIRPPTPPAEAVPEGEKSPSVLRPGTPLTDGPPAADNKASLDDASNDSAAPPPPADMDQSRAPSE